jgi:hypothetical protein
MHARLLAAALIAFTLTLTFTACDGDGGDGDEPTPRTSATSDAGRTPTEEQTTTPSEADAIRDVDLDDVDEVVAIQEETSGTFVQEDVIYADVTDDGVEEAIVPISSEGTLGDVGFVVLTPDDEDGARVLLREVPPGGRGIAVTVEDGKIVTVESVPGPDDAECCPSMLQRTVYGWNGAALALETQTTEPNPDANVKLTPTGG